MSGFKRGDLILTSKPYVYILNNTHRGQLCDFCFQRGSVKRCSQCCFVYFCNEVCQSKGWEQHKEECKYLKGIRPKEPTPSMRLLALILLKLKKLGHDEPYEIAGGEKRCFNSLESHYEDVKGDKEITERVVAFVVALNEYIGVENIPLMTEFMKIFGKMTVNTFSIADSDTMVVGCGLYLGGSIFDHSCEPNAEVVFEGTTLFVRAVTDLPDKDLRKVYISYIDQLSFSEDRKKSLQSQYYFLCQCPRCCNPKYDALMSATSSGSTLLEEKRQHLKRTIQELKELSKNKEKPSIILDKATKEILPLKDILGITNLYRVLLLEFMFDNMIHLQLWPEAIATGLELIYPYQLYYGKYNPIYCLLLGKVGKIQLLLHQNKEAEKHLKMAAEYSLISHGDNHPMYKFIKEMLLQCQKELSFMTS